MNNTTVLSLLAGLLLAAATNVSAWWGGWHPYDPWDPRYWMEEFFGRGWGGYGGPWGGYGYPHYGGWGYGPWGGYGYPYHRVYGYGPWVYRGGWGYVPQLVASAPAANSASE